MQLTATEHDILARARDQLARAAHGESAAIVQRAATTLGVSLPTAYRKLQLAGFASGRKRRSDAGTTELPREELELVAGVLRASLNKKGQRMPVATALDMLNANSKLSVAVSESSVGRQLYAARLHPEQMALPTPSVQLRSLHPNHVWQVDSTTGAYYYLPGGRLRWMPEDQFYKNKVSNWVKASNDLLTRYSVADHTSHAGKVRHYLGGESAENLLDFVTWAMVKQDSGPMHGVPFILMTDPGSSFTSQLFANFCRNVGLRHIMHAPGSARVTGSVEKFHDLVRMHFETRLRFSDPKEVTLERLNTDSEAWCAAYCAHAVHSRHGRTRYGVWMGITAEQLRAASLAVLREAAVSNPETRRVSNDKRITFGSPSKTYDLSQVPGVAAGLRVTLQINVFRSPAINVLFTCPDTGEQTWHVVEPMEVDQWGYGPGPVIGEDMRSAAFGDVDHARNRLTQAAYGLPTVQEADKARKQHAQAYAGVLDAMADVHATAIPTYMPRRGTEHGLPARQVAASTLSVVEACKRLKATLGAAYSPQVYSWVTARFADGVPEDQLDGICASFAQPALGHDAGAAGAAGATGGLRSVGGAA